ncbi:hypothetical protein NA66_102665 [Burkholderia pyrrocinia]|uniref:Uncharacterized protein n=1 Tax=Burkholderia pyrrocinia TaxID=60550 RepID=A0A318I8V3_BURPY|nr:hypothetical protein NA66_102665 [Burkholderia pyrrocinia]SFW83673.1 hypothetical protein SAMN03159384_05789 [Burkholderia sp. NFACC33-1]SFY44785.1 hypothetical protein SAMN03159408_05960 [Burkholderia sp. NFPP32]
MMCQARIGASALDPLKFWRRLTLSTVSQKDNTAKGLNYAPNQWKAHYARR